MQDQNQQPLRKRKRRKEARPSEIISAAIELWKERGFAATRLEDVAKGAGIAKGTIYIYFSSKEALFEAAVQERLVQNIDTAERPTFELSGSTRENLLSFFETVRSEAVDSGGFIFLKVLLAEGHRFPDLVARYETAVLSRGFDAVKGIILRGVERGELSPDAAEFDPRLIMAPAMMLSLWGTVFQGVETPDVSLLHEQHVELIVNKFKME